MLVFTVDQPTKASVTGPVDQAYFSGNPNQITELNIPMGPLTFLLGVILGSAAAITFVLLVVDFLYLVLKPEYPRLGDDLPALGQWTGLFVCMTTAAAFSFYGQLRRRAWWPWAGLATLASITTTVIYAWP